RARRLSFSRSPGFSFPVRMPSRRTWTIRSLSVGVEKGSRISLSDSSGNVSLERIVCSRQCTRLEANLFCDLGCLGGSMVDIPWLHGIANIVNLEIREPLDELLVEGVVCYPAADYDTADPFQTFEIALFLQ